MKKYIFPLNFDYLSKLFGLIEYKILVPLVILGILLIIILSLFDLPFFTKFGIFISIFLPIFLLFNTDVNHEPFYIFLLSLVSHYLKSGKYLLK